MRIPTDKSAPSHAQASSKQDKSSDNILDMLAPNAFSNVMKSTDNDVSVDEDATATTVADEAASDETSSNNNPNAEIMNLAYLTLRQDLPLASVETAAVSENTTNLVTDEETALINGTMNDTQATTMQTINQASAEETTKQALSQPTSMDQAPQSTMGKAIAFDDNDADILQQPTKNNKLPSMPKKTRASKLTMQDASATNTFAEKSTERLFSAAASNTFPVMDSLPNTAPPIAMPDNSLAIAMTPIKESTASLLQSGALRANTQSPASQPTTASAYQSLVLDKIELMPLDAKNGSYQVNINVSPAELGPVVTKLKINKDKAELEILTKNIHVSEMIKQHLPELRAQFSQSNLQLVSVNIHEHQPNFSQNENNNANNEQQYTSADPAASYNPLKKDEKREKKANTMIDAYA